MLEIGERESYLIIHISPAIKNRLGFVNIYKYRANNDNMCSTENEIKSKIR